MYGEQWHGSYNCVLACYGSSLESSAIITSFFIGELIRSCQLKREAVLLCRMQIKLQLVIIVGLIVIVSSKLPSKSLITSYHIP